MGDFDEAAKSERGPGGLSVSGAAEPDIVLNIRNYHSRLRIVTDESTINIQIRQGKLGKVTQTEVIRT